MSITTYNRNHSSKSQEEKWEIRYRIDTKNPGIRYSTECVLNRFDAPAYLKKLNIPFIEKHTHEYRQPTLHQYLKLLSHNYLKKIELL